MSFGASVTSDESAMGCQNLRRYSPAGLPRSTWVSSTFSSQRTVDDSSLRMVAGFRSCSSRTPILTTRIASFLPVPRRVRGPPYSGAGQTCNAY